MAPTSWTQRLALLACLTALVLGGLAADARTPLFERRGEREALELASHLARELRLPDLTDVPPGDLADGAQPPLASLLFAVGLRAAGLADVRWLARRNPRLGRDSRAVWLHGPDELPPRSEPLRRLAHVRSLGLAGAALLLLATFALARRLAPDDRRGPVLAAGLLAVQPGLWSSAGAFTSTVWGAALISLSLTAWVGLARLPERAPARALVGAGLLSGLALLTTPAAWLLVPVAVAVVLARRRRDGGPRLGELALGLLLPTGPWLARNLALYGDPLALDWTWPAGRPHDGGWLAYLEEVWLAQLGEWGHHLRGAGNLADLWVVVSVFGAAGLLWQLLRTRQVCRRGLAVCLAALVLHVLGLLVAQRPHGAAHGALGLVLSGPLAALVAVGWRPWLGSGRAGATLAALGLAGLGALAAVQQRDLLEQTYWPLNRAADGHLLAVDVLAQVPDEARLPVLRFDTPPDGSIHVEAPVLTWTPARDPRARYSVHLTYPGLATVHRSWEDDAVVALDRLQVPEALWRGLPRGVPLLAQLVRLPDPSRLGHEPVAELSVEVSPRRRLYRDHAPAVAED